MIENKSVAQFWVAIVATAVNAFSVLSDGKGKRDLFCEIVLRVMDDDLREENRGSRANELSATRKTRRSLTTHEENLRIF